MCPLCEDDDLGVESINDSELMPDSDGIPLLMEEEVVDLDEDVIVQPPRPLPEPKVPTSAQVAAHNLTHWPYRTCAPIVWQPDAQTPITGQRHPTRRRRHLC